MNTNKEVYRVGTLILNLDETGRFNIVVKQTVPGQTGVRKRNLIIILTHRERSVRLVSHL